MKVRSILAVGGVLLLAGTLAFALGTEPIAEVRDRSPSSSYAGTAWR